ncbi:ATP-dependent DNA helicase RecQ [Sporobacter termitidis DSM 10068]|uniref:DNA helicase RecQ n=1 Tax=Sporobacter termitidis DSM 10068 TaxID=1123282 RepID=A0A1M5ZDL8_9FIRM|nr:DNA helicase RecQ [Sporobacter termitidis]SHI22261.1 ATP-dependent DNA helicase RecQ [Sporobacter termitidis DSM 10068]
MDKLTALKRYFGHTSFRPGQEQVIDALLDRRDALGVMPTGAGKSMCYQIPALLLPGVTLVVSPLISLMKDQVSALVQAGVAAAFINSSLSAAQYREVFRRAEAGRYKIIYVAPERLATGDFLRFAEQQPISLVAVDEAHCVSQWGQDFRPGYLKIVDFIERLSYRPTVGAFTATATADVKTDIARILKLCDPLTLTTGFDRANLYFEVVKPKSKPAYLWELLRQRRGKSGIIYCATRAGVERVCDDLRAHGVSATRYHAGLDDEERRANQDDFVYDRRRVMVATNAFGMGIDKSNVSFVIHYNMPKNLESYYQEAGRAGRDGAPADCILLFSTGDISTAKFLIQNADENEALTDEERETIQKRDLERLDRMVGYCRTGLCLRAYILAYFGEPHDGHCGNCGSCKSDFENLDITVDAQKILSCVSRVGKRYAYGLGVTLIIRMLHGSREQRILQLGLDTLPTYGILRGTDRRRIREIVDYLVDEDYLQVTEGEYPVLRLTDRSAGVLFHGETVAMPVRKPPAALKQERRAPGAAEQDLSAAQEDALLSALKALRAKLAQESGVPAYIVFSNITLEDMAAKRPRTMPEFLEVSGVGEVKAARYGEAFLRTISEYIEN